MKKEYLEELRKKLNFLTRDEIEIIINKYDRYIDKEKESGKSIKSVLDDLGDASGVANSIKYEYEVNNSKTFLNKSTGFIIRKAKEAVNILTKRQQRPLVKMIIQLVIIIISLLFISIPFSIVSNLGVSVLNNLPITISNYASFFWKISIQLAYLVISILLFYIFVKNYIEDIDSNKIFLRGIDRSFIINTNEELIIKNVLEKMLVFIRALIYVLFVPFFIILILLGILLIYLFLLMYSKIFLLSFILMVISLIIFDIGIIMFFDYFIGDCKEKKYSILFSSSLFLFVFASMFGIIEFNTYKYYDEFVSEEQVTSLNYGFSIGKDEEYVVDGERVTYKVVEDANLINAVTLEIKYYKNVTDTGYSFIETGVDNSIKNLSVKSLIKGNNKYYKIIKKQLKEDLKSRKIQNYEKLMESTVVIKVPKGMKNSIKFSDDGIKLSSGEVYYGAD